MSKSHDITLTVILGHEIANELDNALSPMDGIVAIGQVTHELASIHRTSRRRRWFQASLPIYRGLIDWCGIGFDYVEHRGYLHVLAIRDDYTADSVDAVIHGPEDAGRYVHEVGCGGGVSIIS